MPKDTNSYIRKGLEDRSKSPVPLEEQDFLGLLSKLEPT